MEAPQRMFSLEGSRTLRKNCQRERGAELGKKGRLLEYNVGHERYPVNTPTGLGSQRWPWMGQHDRRGRIHGRKGQ